MSLHLVANPPLLKNVEEIEDEDVHPKGNIPPKNPCHILEPLLDDDDGFEYTTSSHKKATATGSASGKHEAA